ncbi:hypothetical protein [Helicobacter ailurogastricus]|uniref:hypothetical protein n=1 Tax=Helicobacter ailurogastricus TaxID=1578720 RepID=UPI00255594A7|nr:hypothetical protein [Helicobacter ailurogastricus]
MGYSEEAVHALKFFGMAVGNLRDPMVYMALLFYFLASLIFKANEIEEHGQWWFNLTHNDLDNFCRFLGAQVHHITFDFDTFTETHDFGKLVCFCVNDKYLGSQYSIFSDKMANHLNSLAIR